MARVVQIALTPLEESITRYTLTLPASTWDAFLAIMVRLNTTQGAALDEAIGDWINKGDRHLAFKKYGEGGLP